MRYKTAEALMAVFLSLVCAVAWANIRTLPADALMFPRFILIILAICSLVMLVRGYLPALKPASAGASTSAPDTNTPPSMDEDKATWHFAISPVRMVGAVVLFAIYILLVGTIGFFTSSALFIIALAWYARYRNWTALVSSAIGFCIFVYVVFVMIFDRPLPTEWVTVIYHSLTGGALT